MAGTLRLVLALSLAAVSAAAQRAGRNAKSDSLPVGSILNRCGTWRLPAPTRGDSVLVDVYFGVTVPRRRGPVGPTRNDLAALRTAGARVVRRFPFRAVRALIPAAQLTAFPGTPEFRDVPDPQQYNWEIFLIYRRKLRARDTAEWRILGGRVRAVYEDIGTIYGVLPDSAIRVLSTRHWLRAIEANLGGCVSGSGLIAPLPNGTLQSTFESRSNASLDRPSATLGTCSVSPGESSVTLEEPNETLEESIETLEASNETPSRSIASSSSSSVTRPVLRALRPSVGRGSTRVERRWVRPRRQTSPPFGELVPPASRINSTQQRKNSN